MSSSRRTAGWLLLCSVALLPLATTGIAKYFGAKASGQRFDNANPRAWQQRQTGLPVGCISAVQIVGGCAQRLRCTHHGNLAARLSGESHADRGLALL